ncbi:MAG: acyltransferase [Candidatus Eisenbacteria bacterium]|nr:acyltransferase [Candidatus Eisenbacteria bacterium]
MGSSRFVWLDAVRFLAAFSVLVAHARASFFVEYGALPVEQQNALSGLFYALTRLGSEAVIFFFVLSGFLVGGGTAQRVVEKRFDVKRFAIDRSSRILVPYVPALILTVAVCRLGGCGAPAAVVLGNLAFMQEILVPSLDANRPLWSLPYEVWFYATLGGAGILVSRRRLTLVAAPVLVISGTVLLALEWTYVACMIIGAVARIRLPGRPSLVRTCVSVVVCFIAVTALQLASPSRTLPAPFWWLPSAVQSRVLLGIGASLAIQQLALAAPRTRSSSMVAGWTTGLAGFSYTLYLTHYPLLRAMQRLGVERAARISSTSVLRFGAGLGACILFGWLFGLLFERRTADVRKWLGARTGVHANH